jgi:Rrf2 family transcriptional regulator, cysteine metabolism repressor
MKISSRSRYGIRLLYELALNYGKGLVYLKDISANQEISEKYLGQIIIPLRAAGFVSSSRGAHGGYSLSRPPAKINLLDVVNTLEGSNCIVECIKDPTVCNRTEKCPTRGIWEKLDRTICDYLRSVTIEDILKTGCEDSDAVFYQI